VCIYIRIYTGW